jgi:hypothetical protein
MQKLGAADWHPSVIAYQADVLVKISKRHAARLRSASACGNILAISLLLSRDWRLMDHGQKIVRMRH